VAELIEATKVYYSTVEGFVTSDPLLLNLRRMAGHIERERNMYVFAGGRVLDWRNRETCGDTLMNGHWEELFGKVEELLHATDNPDNYQMHIQHIIRSTSDGRQYFESFLRLHVRKRVQGVIEAMSSSGASGCALALVDLRQQLVDRVDRAEWIFEWMGHPIVDQVFEEVLSDHPDLRDVVKAQVNVSQSSNSPW